MRSIVRGVFVESRYPGVTLGAIGSRDSLLLVDSPIRVEDGREWLAQLAEKGKPRYLVLLDHHPDRVLGARVMGMPILAHDETRLVMGNWADTFKGNARPIGAEADRLKRITGVGKAVPELTFSTELLIHLGDRVVRLLHRPGPTAGAIWVVLEEAKVVFVGDAVTVGEPPFMADADLEAWVETLGSLSGPSMRGYTIIAGRDGVVERRHVTAMAAWLQRVPERLHRLGDRANQPEAITTLAGQLLRPYKLPASRRETGLLRLQLGLARQQARLEDGEG
jgi:glyoxylase-like metal-dependent hydrolase (beta-lactamase superfamily II)